LKNISDKYFYSSEPPFVEHDTSSPSTDLHNVIGYATSDIHTATYPIEDNFHNVYHPPKSTEWSKYCYAKAQAFDPAYVDYMPLNRQALQHHNTRNKLPRTDNTTQHPHSQEHAYTSISRDTAGHTPSTTQYEYMEVEPYFYPRQSHQLRIPALFQQENEQRVDTTSADYLIHHQAPYPYLYPTSIAQVDLTGQPLDHQTRQTESYPNPLPIHQVPYQASISSSYVFTGIGSQFSA
jgi:hypothetical protein